MLLFLVAAGLSLIFGTLKVTNFMHGPLYMLGAHFAYRLYNLTGGETMASALGINSALVFGSVFALGGLLAGLAGALAVPVRSMVAGMGFSILIESFIVTVIGGMGSVAGALVGALLIGLVRSFGTIGFPLFTEGIMFLFMTVFLIARPSGLFGKDQ